MLRDLALRGFSPDARSKRSIVKASSAPRCIPVLSAHAYTDHWRPSRRRARARIQPWIGDFCRQADGRLLGVALRCTTPRWPNKSWSCRRRRRRAGRDDPPPRSGPPVASSTTKAFSRRSKSSTSPRSPRRARREICFAATARHVVRLARRRHPFEMMLALTSLIARVSSIDIHDFASVSSKRAPAG